MPFFATVCKGNNALAAPRLTERICISNEHTPVLKLPPVFAFMCFLHYIVVSSRFIEKLVFLI